MPELISILAILFAVFAVITLVGHGIWVLLAMIFGAVMGRAGDSTICIFCGAGHPGGALRGVWKGPPQQGRRRAAQPPGGRSPVTALGQAGRLPPKRVRPTACPRPRLPQRVAASGSGAAGGHAASCSARRGAEGPARKTGAACRRSGCRKPRESCRWPTDVGQAAKPQAAAAPQAPTIVPPATWPPVPESATSTAAIASRRHRNDRGAKCSPASWRSGTSAGAS